MTSKKRCVGDFFEQEGGDVFVLANIDYIGDGVDILRVYSWTIAAKFVARGTNRVPRHLAISRLYSHLVVDMEHIVCLQRRGFNSYFRINTQFVKSYFCSIVVSVCIGWLRQFCLPQAITKLSVPRNSRDMSFDKLRTLDSVVTCGEQNR